MTATPRIALVTGATQGLGRALVEGLARRLAPTDIVLLTSRDPDRVERAVSEIRSHTSTVAHVEGRVVDVTDGGAVRALAGELDDRFGGVDLVFSNATARMSPERSPEDQVDAQLDTSNVATSRLLRTILP